MKTTETPSNVVRIEFRNSVFAAAFQKWMLSCAEKEHIEKFFTRTADNEWRYEEDETALPGDFWMPGRND